MIHEILPIRSVPVLQQTPEEEFASLKRDLDALDQRIGELQLQKLQKGKRFQLLMALLAKMQSTPESGKQMSTWHDQIVTDGFDESPMRLK